MVFKTQAMPTKNQKRKKRKDTIRKNQLANKQTQAYAKKLKRAKHN